MRTLTIALVFVLVVSSIALVRLRHANRQQFVELQQLYKQRDDLNIGWGQLQIEKRTYAKHDRIERYAVSSLNMHVPQPNELVIVTQMKSKAAK